MMKKEMKIEITELFMAKADWKRCFHGVIKREKDENGNQVFSSKIYVKNKKFDEVIYSQVIHPTKTNRELRDQLGEQLDDIVKLILDYKLTKMPAKTQKIGDQTFNLN
jgi:hypothetical protein